MATNPNTNAVATVLTQVQSPSIRKSSALDVVAAEQSLDAIRQMFLKLPFDTKITLVNWCKDLMNNERRGSASFNMEEDYLNSIARRQSIINSVMHIAPLLPGFVIVAIVVSTICTALIIPFFKMITCGSPYLMSAWKALITVLFSLPLMIHEMRKYGDGVNKLFSVKNMLTVLLCQVFSVLQTFCQLIAMRMTYSSHVLLFSGMASVVLFFWKIIKRLPVTSLEIAGILIALFGSAVISQSGGGSSSEYSAHDIVAGDMICFLGSVFSAFNFQILAPLLQVYRIGIYLVLSNSWVFMISLVSVFFSGFSMSFGLDAMTGFFGFLNPKNIAISIFCLGLIGTYGALFTILISLQYLSPMIVALSSLVQPMIAQIFSTALGLEGFPGIMTIIGGAVVLGGLFMVSQSAPVESKRKASLRALSISDPLLASDNAEVADSIKIP